MSDDPYALLRQISGGIYTGAAPPPMIQQRTANADRRATARAQRTSPSAHAPPARGSAQARPVFVTGATLNLPHSSVAKPLALNATIMNRVIAAPPKQVAVPPPPAPMPRSLAPASAPLMLPSAAARQAIIAAPPPPMLVPTLSAQPRTIATILNTPVPPPPPPVSLATLANSPALRQKVMASMGPPMQVGPGAALSSAQASQARAIANRAMNGPGPLGQPSGISSRPSGMSSVPYSSSLPISQSAALASAAFANGMSLPPPSAQYNPAAFAAPPRATSPNTFAAPSRGAGPQPKPARGSMRYQPTGKRTYCPFVSLQVAASATVDIIVRPQLVFRADEIIVGSTVAALPFNLVQVKIGVVPQAVAGGEVPTECFPAQNGPKFGFDIADQGTDITMTVKNYNAAAKDFYGILVGDEVYPVAA